MMEILTTFLKETASLINLGLEAASDNLDAFLVSIKEEPERSFCQLDRTVHRLHRLIPRRREWDGARDEITQVTTNVSRLLLRLHVPKDGPTPPEEVENIASLRKQVEFCQTYLARVELEIAKANGDLPPPASLHDHFLDLKNKIDLSYFD